MRVIKAILAAATLLAGFTFNAKAADPIEGKDYAVISPALQNDSPARSKLPSSSGMAAPIASISKTRSATGLKRPPRMWCCATFPPR
jgi:hypothetical protein